VLEEEDMTLAQTMLAGWLLVFIPLGLIGLGVWALRRLAPRLRTTMGYGTNPYRPGRMGKHPCSK
jgi:uncharacterized membrane protein YqjE